ncbi:MAG: PHP domain-containing protein [Clostridia bacterium]|nr:PHP domain-containing protein [Clostridia bacterium]
MEFFGDYHTHTVNSRKAFLPYYHAKGTLEDNVSYAKKIGLQEIAIADHGFNHKFFSCSRKKREQTKAEIERLSQKYNIKVYFGVEANFISTDGTIDIIDDDLKYLDIVLCGFHKTVKTKTIKDKFLLLFSNIFSSKKINKKLYDRNTNMVLSALDKYNIDILTHLNSKMKCDVVKIAKKCAEKGTYIELNEKHCDFTKKEVEEMLKTEVMFIVDSDAHRPEKIGSFLEIKKLIKNYAIPEDRIANLNKKPVFLNQNLKQNNLLKSI